VGRSSYRAFPVFIGACEEYVEVKAGKRSQVGRGWTPFPGPSRRVHHAELGSDSFGTVKSDRCSPHPP
jgi:hypothetical protein